MPLSKDEAGGGTEADGSKSTEYCSHCYQKGTFTEPTITLEQMQEKVTGKMKNMHVPNFLAKYFTKDMDQLKRWQSH